MSDAGVTCRNTTVLRGGVEDYSEEGERGRRMIARSYRALFWTHMHARPEHCRGESESGGRAMRCDHAHYNVESIADLVADSKCKKRGG